ncbi:hypothetical protein ACFS4T_25010 [Pseudomonas lini]
MSFFSRHGQNAIAVLLFQDVVAVLLLTLVPVFAGTSDQVWYWALPLTLGKTIVLFVGLLLVSRWFFCHGCFMKSPRPGPLSCSCCWRW